MMMKTALIAPALFAAFIALPAFAAGDAEKGEKVFRKCSACHSVAPDAGKRPGPSLYGIMERTVGSVADFDYSAPLEAARQAGDTWDADRMTRFLAAPKALYPGNKMAFAGLKKESELLDIIAYLQQHSPAQAQD